jgi:hypothetical protein
MSDQPDPVRVRITSPDEMTQILPYLIGFTPEESLVIAVIDHGAIAVTARVDLDAVHPAGEAEHLLDRIWARFPEAGAYLVAYTTQPTAGWALLDRCADHLPPTAARQMMVVDGDTWQLPGGLTGAADRYGPRAAEASFHGLQRLPSRSQLAAGFASAPDTTTLAAHVEAALDNLPGPHETDAIIARMRDLLGRNLPADSAPVAAPGHASSLDVEDAIELAVLAQHPKAREVAMLSITRQDAEDHLGLWRAVVNNVPEYGAEAPLFLAGIAAWAAGEGAAAAIALERIAQVGGPEPYRPARVLDELIEQVVPPSAWDELRTDGLADADPRVRAAVTGTGVPAGWESVPQHDLRRRPQPPDLAPPAPGIAI